jgi:HlyD family secretion protein
MNVSQQDDVAKTLGIDDSTRRRGLLWRWLAAAIGVASVLTAGWYYFAATESSATRYVTAAVERGDLDVTVTATGTLEPINDVEISSELSGIVRKVLVDYNDRVTAGQILAELDTDKLKAEVAHANATLAASKARVKVAQAVLARTKQDFERYRRLSEANSASLQRYEEAVAANAQAAATLESTEAEVAVAEADLQLKEADLKKACICSPIDGIVLQRNVEPGQTVAATLQAPVLFTLAKDLAAMELQVDVDEADVGLVEAGQSAVFTVDAYPDRTFSAVVTKVRYAPQTTENVVTYTTHLTVDNSHLLLRPGMTATAEISVQTVKDAVLIPNEALRFAPPAPKTDSDGASLLSRILPHPPAVTRLPAGNAVGSGSQKQVWVLKDGVPAEVFVSVGLSDGERTEITDGDLQPGQEVVIDSVDSGS